MTQRSILTYLEAIKKTPDLSVPEPEESKEQVKQIDDIVKKKSSSGKFRIKITTIAAESKSVESNPEDDAPKPSPRK